MLFTTPQLCWCYYLKQAYMCANVLPVGPHHLIQLWGNDFCIAGIKALQMMVILRCLSSSWPSISVTTTVGSSAWELWSPWTPCSSPPRSKAPGAPCSAGSWARPALSTTGSWAHPAHSCREKDWTAPWQPERPPPAQRCLERLGRQKTTSPQPNPRRRRDSKLWYEVATSKGNTYQSSFPFLSHQRSAFLCFPVTHCCI